MRLLNVICENEPDENVWPLYNDSIIKICLINLSSPGIETRDEYFKNYLGIGYNNKAVLSISNNKLQEAIKYFELSIQNLGSSNKDTLLLIAMCNLADTYKKAGLYLKASEIYNEVLQKSLKKNYLPGMVSAYKFLGALSERLKDYSKAKKYYFNSIEICRKNNMEDDLSRVYHDLAHVYTSLSQADSSIFYFKKAYELKIKTHQDVAAIRTLISMAMVYTQMGEFATAKANLDEAAESLPKQGNEELNSYLKQAYCRLYIHEKKYDKAIIYAKDAWDISSKTTDLSLKVGSAGLLSQAYEYNHDGMNSLEMYKVFARLKDSANSLELKNMSNEMEVKHGYEKKSLIDSLKRNDEIKLSNYKIEKQESQKYILIIVITIITLLCAIIFRRFRISVQQNKIIEKQKNEVDLKNKVIEEKQKEILDSIHYANKIQNALLADKSVISKNFKGSFIFFKPKDIVSGDFYWTATVSIPGNEHGMQASTNKAQNGTQEGELFYLAVCDSTGHGVPGAFMCLLNMGFISEAINEKKITLPNEIFNYARKRLIESIGTEGQKDGFDGILLCLNKLTGSVTYAAANNTPILIQDNELIELPKDRMPVGKGESEISFKNYNVNLKEGDTLYLFTDGFADQFGGPKGKKFKYKELNRLFSSIAAKPLALQEKSISETFENWKGNLEQVDDICIIGISF